MRYPFPPHQEQASLSRRRFLAGLGLATTALLVSRKGWAAESVPECAYALNPLASVLPSYSPPQGVVAAGGSAILEFDLVGWNKDAGKKQLTVEDLRRGVFRVARTIEGERISYEINRQFDDDICEGKILCRAGKPETVESWEVRWSRPSDTPQGWEPLTMKGFAKEGGVRLQGYGRERTQACPTALVADTSLLFNPGLLEILSREPAGFARLDQTLVMRPGQRVRLAGSVHSPWGGPPLRAWMMSGRGLVPTHFVHDGENRPLFLTGLLVSSTLKSIS